MQEYSSSICNLFVPVFLPSSVTSDNLPSPPSPTFWWINHDMSHEATVLVSMGLGIIIRYMVTLIGRVHRGLDFIFKIVGFFFFSDFGRVFFSYVIQFCKVFLQLIEKHMKLFGICYYFSLRNYTKYGFLMRIFLWFSVIVFKYSKGFKCCNSQ